MVLTAKALGITLAVIVVIALLCVGLYFAIWSTAEPRGALSAREQIIANADFRIAAYDWYFDQCKLVKDRQAKLDRQDNLLAVYEEGSAGWLKKHEEVAALEGLTEESANSYNANSDKEQTRGAFKETCLPDRIDPIDAVEQARNGKRVTCECQGWQSGPY